MSGLEARFNVSKINDPTGKHNDCRYFVLDPEHDRDAYNALMTYAYVTDNDELSADLFAWLRAISS